jgi:mannose-6-phosphate isomerase-like protein (cupin superfamily)
VSGAISIPEALDALSGPWQPADVVRVNDAIVRVARLEGEFPWHVHDEDELFLCWDGEFVIELEGAEPVRLNRGDVFVVAKGVRHRPVAAGTAHAILLERPETEQYGNR